MECNFNFYDISTYILPGLITLFFGFWFIFDIFGYNFFAKIGSISCAILIIIISYGIGYLILPIGSIIDHFLVNKSENHYSYRVMTSCNNEYSSEYKTQIKRISEEKFHIKWDEPLPENKSRYNELFYLCYYYATNKTQTKYIDTFNGIYGLFRNFTSIGVIGFTISVIILVKNYIIYLIPVIPHYYWPYSTTTGFVGLIFSIFIFVSSLSQQRRFNKHFIDSIYRNFYVLSLNKQANEDIFVQTDNIQPIR